MVSIKQKGFTIVELLIVIVVIGILAAITIVAYNGVQNKARLAQVTSAASQAAKKVRLHHADNAAYPADLATVGIANSPSVTYDYTQSGQWFCVAAKTTGANPVTAGSGSNGSCSQLNASYYSNDTLSGSPILTRFDPNVYFNWGTGSPDASIPVNNFSASWTGFITAPTTDTYTFYMFYDDRFRLYINNTLVADHWTTGCCTERTITYPFTAGQALPFKVEMVELTGNASAMLQWSYTGQVKTPVPPSAFSTP